MSTSERPKQPNHPKLSLRRQGSPVALVFMDPQEDLPLHEHAHVELVLITGGHGTHLLSDAAWPIQRGDVFAIPPQMRHGYADCDTLQLSNICIDASWCERNQLRSIPGFNAFITLEPLMRSQHDFSSHLQLQDESIVRLEELIAEMRREMELQESGYIQSLKLRLDLLLIELSRKHGQNSSHQHEALLQLEGVLRYIDAQIGQTITLATLCTQAAMSVSTLTRYFQRCFGCSPMHFVLQRRLQLAQDLLRNSERRISDIAKSVGIQNPNYFSRVYKKYFKHSPQEQRRQT